MYIRMDNDMSAAKIWTFQTFRIDKMCVLSDMYDISMTTPYVIIHISSSSKQMNDWLSGPGIL